MNVKLVVERNGRSEIRWEATLLLALVLGLVCATIAAAMYYLLSGTFSLLATSMGFVGPCLTIASGIRAGLKAPIRWQFSLGSLFILTGVAAAVVAAAVWLAK